jgi:hypothetical protein
MLTYDEGFYDGAMSERDRILGLLTSAQLQTNELCPCDRCKVMLKLIADIRAEGRK